MSRARSPLHEFTPNSQGTIAKLVVREQLEVPSGFFDAVSPNSFDGLLYRWRDDWCQSQILSVGWDNAPIGGPPYSLTVSGALSSMSAVVGVGRIGVQELRANAAAGVVALSTQRFIQLPLFTSLDFTAVVAFANLSTALEAFVAVVSADDGAGNGFGFMYDRENVNGGNPTNLDQWLAYTSEAGVYTWTVLPEVIAPVVWPNTNVFRLAARYDAATGSITFTVNGVDRAYHTTNIPTIAALSFGPAVQRQAGALVRSMYLDYTELGFELVANRYPG